MAEPVDWKDAREIAEDFKDWISVGGLSNLARAFLALDALVGEMAAAMAASNRVIRHYCDLDDLMPDPIAEHLTACDALLARAKEVRGG